MTESLNIVIYLFQYCFKQCIFRKKKTILGILKLKCRSPLHEHSRKRGLFYARLLSQNPFELPYKTQFRPRTLWVLTIIRLLLASSCQVPESRHPKGIAPDNERYSKTFVNCSTPFSCSGTLYVNFGCNFIICSFSITTCYSLCCSIHYTVNTYGHYRSMT